MRIYRIKRPGGEFTFSVDYRVGGERHRTAFVDYARARLEAEQAAKRLAIGDAAALNLSALDAAIYGRALEITKPFGIRLDALAEKFAEAAQEVGHEFVVAAAKEYAKRHPKDMPRKTVAEVVEELLAAKTAAQRSARHVQDLHYRCGAFAEAFRCPIAAVTSGDLRRYLELKKVAPRTFKNHYGAVKNLVEFAKGRGYLPKDCDLLDGIEIPRDHGGEIEIYSPLEIQSILNAANDDILPSIAISAFSGLRSQEVERLDWGEVDLKNRFIQVAKQKAKTGARRLAPIPDNLAAWLAPYAGRRGPVWAGAHFGFYKTMQKTAAKAGIPWRHNALRHSFCSYRLAVLQNAAQCALEAGNSPAMIFAHYRELVRPDQAAKWFAVQPAQPGNVILLAVGE